MTCSKYFNISTIVIFFFLYFVEQNLFAQLQIKNYPDFKNTVINIKLKKKDKKWLIMVPNFI